MSEQTVEDFITEVESAVKGQFASYEIEILLQTEKSFKANIHLQKRVFIAVRYNARNERTDFALIKNEQRIFGYDNLKEWHYHPYSDPSEHVPCDQPSIDKIVSDIKEAYDWSRSGRKGKRR